jgi:hypothetical protein
MPVEPTREAEIHKFDGVHVYGRKDPRGRAATVDAIDEDRQAIDHIADVLQRRGYGVHRERDPRAGRTYYTLKATWAGHGDPPVDPFDRA